jgi:multicomponent Na+:H+ antiporter subunit G
MEINTVFTVIQEVLFSIFMLLGLIFCFIGLLGLFRFKDVYSKQHATGLIDTAGIFFICLALAIKSGLSLVSFKPLFLSLLIALISAPLCYAFMQILIHRGKDKTLESLKNK